MIQIIKNLAFNKIFITVSGILILAIPEFSYAFPIYAQQGYENPREANGRIVCANCHLAQKPVQFEVPRSVLPNDIFEAQVSGSYDIKTPQLLGNGQKGGINIGAVVILPEGFKLAPKSRLDTKLKEKVKKAYITPYSTLKENILVVGPINEEKNKEITFPLLAPDPKLNKNIFFGKYPIYAGVNRGRAQINPTGDKTNNNAYISAISGTIQDIQETDKIVDINILSEKGIIKTQSIPKGLALLVKKNQAIAVDEPLTENPNVGGFGQAEAEITLQDPARIKSYLAFCASIILAQSMLVFKKKQFEKVQAAELDF